MPLLMCCGGQGRSRHPQHCINRNMSKNIAQRHPTVTPRSFSVEHSHDRPTEIPFFGEGWCTPRSTIGGLTWSDCRTCLTVRNNLCRSPHPAAGLGILLRAGAGLPSVSPEILPPSLLGSWIEGNKNKFWAPGMCTSTPQSCLQFTFSSPAPQTCPKVDTCLNITATGGALLLLPGAQFRGESWCT